MNALLLLSQKTIQDLVTISIENHGLIPVIPRDLEKGIAPHLTVQTSVELIVCEYPTYSGELLEVLASIQRKVPLLVFDAETTAQPPDFQNQKVVGQFVASKVNSVNDLLDQFVATIDWPAPQPTEENKYIRITIEVLSDVKKLPTDIYIRLSAKKFVKVFHKDDLFEASDQEKYLVQKKIPYLFILKSESDAMVGILNEKLRVTLAAAAPSEKEVQNVVVSVQDATSALLQRLGPTPAVQEMMRQNSELVVKSLGKTPSLKGLLDKILADKDNYLASHSIALGQLCCTLAHSLEWESDMTFQKLVMAGFLHDGSLSDHEMAKIRSEDELRKRAKELGVGVVQIVTNHPLKGEDLAKKFSQLPPDVDKIIAQHHERPDGKGFPRKLNAKQIGPLPSLFILAHDILHEIYDGKTDFDLIGFLKFNKGRYQEGHFKKIYDGLIKAQK